MFLTRVLLIMLALASVSALLLLGGCPKGGNVSSKVTVDAGSPQSQAEDAAAQSADADAEDEAKEFEESSEDARESEAPAAPPNPKPGGDNWIWPLETAHRVGEEISFEFRLAIPQPALAVLVRSEIDPRVWQPQQLLAESHSEVRLQDGGAGSLRAMDDGRWRLVLFADAGDTSSVVAEGNEIVISEWPRGGNNSNSKPYLTIGNPTEAGEVSFNPGQAVVGYFELEEPYAPGAWIGLVPADTSNSLEMYSEKAALEIKPIGTSVKDSPLFILTTPGRYVLRIFPSDLDGCEWTLESEPFSVAVQQVEENAER